MSSIPKHFRLKYKEEFYMHKELEKFRKEVKEDFLQFKQRLASKPAIDEGPVRGHQPPCPQALGQTSPGERKHISPAGVGKPSGSPRTKGPGTPAGALLQEALQGAVRSPGPGEAVVPVKARPFCPQDFYRRSSAYHRHPPARKPPVIAPGAGTSRPAVLLPTPAPPAKPRAHLGAGSAQTAASRPVADAGRARDTGAGTARPAEARKAGRRQTKSTPGEGGDAKAASGRGTGRIRTRFLREGCERRAAAGPEVSKSDGESLLPRDALEAGPALLPARRIPTSLEEIIGSLQSEAQLASDQTIKELIQSVLGQNYDIKMEVGEPQPE